MEELERPNHEAARDHALAKRAHAQLGPDAAQRARMLARLETAISGPTPEARADRRPLGAPRLRAHKGWLWLVPLLALLGGVSWLVIGSADDLADDRAREAANRRTPPFSVPAPIAMRTPTPSVGTPASPESAAPQAKRIRRDAPSAPDPVAELALLERARRILVRDPARTLALTEEHRSRFRTPSFPEERELLAIEALLRSHQRGAAEQRARAFARSYPRSLHAHRLAAIMQGEAP